MTSEIKYSWLTANDEKPNRVKAFTKYYSKRQSKLRTILINAKTFGIFFSEEDARQIYMKYYFYNIQWKKLYSYHRYLITRKPGEQWDAYKDYFTNVEEKLNKEANYWLNWYLKNQEIY